MADNKSQASRWQRGWNASVAWLERVAAQRHVLALRDGMIASVPVILVGSAFLLLGAQSEILTAYFDGSIGWLPNWVDTSLGQWYLGHIAMFYVPYRLTMGMLALYVAFTIAYSLAEQYKMPPLPQGLGAVAALLLTGTVDKAALSGVDTLQWVIPLKPLGPEGLFLAIVLGVCMVEISRWFGMGKPRPQTETAAIPPAVRTAFQSFLPMLLLVTLVWAVRYIADLDVNAAFSCLLKPLYELGDSLPAVLLSNFFMHLFAVAGVHGISVINAVMLPLWQQFVSANAEAHAAGLPLPHITAFPFYQWFVWMGGAGATLPATVWLLFRSGRWRKLGKIALVPALFNINEPFLFGMPVVANPLLAIPCILAPLACGTLAWFALEAGYVSPPFLEVPWVLPCFLGAPLSTQDWRSLVLLALNLLVAGAIWHPFLKVYTQRAEAKAAEEVAGQSGVSVENQP